MLCHARARNEENERRERLRYELLERLYLLTGADPATVVSATAIEDELALPADAVAGLLDDLALLGYVAVHDDPPRIRLTPQAIAYLQTKAWRRRTVRG